MPRRSAGGLRYSSAAAREYLTQFKHYATTAPGLELLFVAAIRQAEALAIGNPEGFARAVDDEDLRVIVVRRFPFKLFYVVRGDVVVIAKLAHTSRSLEMQSKRRN